MRAANLERQRAEAQAREDAAAARRKKEEDVQVCHLPCNGRNHCLGVDGSEKRSK